MNQSASLEVTSLGSLSFAELHEGHPLFQRYVAGDPSVQEWYGSSWLDDGAVKAAWTGLQTHAVNRSALVKALEAQSQRFRGWAKVTGRIRQLADPRATVVMTGQQAGLFGGPLYTWLKAATAIRTAKRYENLVGHPVVPVFWIAADDHDFREIDHCAVLDALHAVRRLTYAPGRDVEGWPASRIPLTDGMQRVWRELEAALPSSEYRAELLTQLQACYGPDDTMVSAMGRWLAEMFGAHGLVVADASDPALKQLGSSVFAREIREHPASRRLYDERTHRLSEAGVSPQIHLPEDVFNLMWMDGTRQPMRERNGTIEMGGQPAPFSRDALVEQLRLHPEKGSPNVLLNSIYQDTVFPALGHVLGPAETAYHAQVRPLYGRFGMVPPVLIPRVSATLFTRRAAAGLREMEVLPAEALVNAHGAFQHVKHRAVPEALRQALAKARAGFGGPLVELERLLETFDAGVAGQAARVRTGAEGHFAKLEEKIADVAERKNESLQRRIHAIKQLIRPDGALQERVLSPLSFLVRLGPGLTAALVERLPEDVSRHHLVEIAGAQEAAA